VAGTEELFYANDFQAFISKPIDVMQLDSVIMRWIKNRPAGEPLDEPPAAAPGSLQEERILGIEIPGVNTEKGLAICGGDRKIYLSILRSYVADTSAGLTKMRNVTKETLPGYITAVHGIKGSSDTIGAEEIKEAASNLETMAKNGYLSGVLAKNDDFLKDAECIVAAIKSWLEKHDGKSMKPWLPAPDRELLIRLRQCCEQRDIDGAEKTVSELDMANYEHDADLVTWLREKVSTLDFDEAAGRLMEHERAARHAALG